MYFTTLQNAVVKKHLRNKPRNSSLFLNPQKVIYLTEKMCDSWHSVYVFQFCNGEA